MYDVTITTNNFWYFVIITLYVLNCIYIADACLHVDQCRKTACKSSVLDL